MRRTGLRPSPVRALGDGVAAQHPGWFAPRTAPRRAGGRRGRGFCIVCSTVTLWRARTAGRGCSCGEGADALLGGRHVNEGEHREVEGGRSCWLSARRYTDPSPGARRRRGARGPAARRRSRLEARRRPLSPASQRHRPGRRVPRRRQRPAPRRDGVPRSRHGARARHRNDRALCTKGVFRRGDRGAAPAISAAPGG